MQTDLDLQLETVERNSIGWKSLTYFDRSLLQQLASCLKLCITLTSDQTFLEMIIVQRPQAFDTFEYVATYLFKEWYYHKRPLLTDQIHYLSIVGAFNRRLTLTLQNDSDDKQRHDYFEHQKRVRELLFDNNDELFDILLTILPEVSGNELNFIEMILPWYESYIFFEHSYIDSTLDEKFLFLNQQIIQSFKSDQYERSLLLIENNQTMITTVRHRFYLGVCTMAMGVHVNCDENECDQAKNLLELYLPRYTAFIHSFLNENQENFSNSFACLTGLVTYLVNYTLIITDNPSNRQLLIDLYSLILQENLYVNIQKNWTTYETIIIDIILGYLIVYCSTNRSIVEELVRIDEKFVDKLEKLITHAQTRDNRRIAIICQLFLLILSSCTKNKDLSENLLLSCFNYIQKALNNPHSFHYNRIPMSMFFKSLIHIVKHQSIQKLISKQHLKLLRDVVCNYNKESLSNDVIYQECTMITFDLLWSLSFNETVKKFLKQSEQNFFDVILKMNNTTNDTTVKQATCGLLYNIDRLILPRKSAVNGDNFGKTIGISSDSADLKTVQMIVEELNKIGYRVWITYDHINDHFLPSFISMMKSTQYLIVCLSDAYRWNNRCRNELLYATEANHHVLSWKVHPSTDDEHEDENTRKRSIETLQNRISIPTSDTLVSFSSNDDLSPKERFDLEKWTNTDVLTWCRTIDAPGFIKLLETYDGQSVIKLYDFCKQNSTETITILNKDLHRICQQKKIDPIQISIHEFIHFQIEVKKLLQTSSSLKQSTFTLTASERSALKKRWNTKTCIIL